MLKEFGIWYIDYGYLIATLLALPGGIWCGNKPKKYIIGFVCLLLFIGLLAIYGKHST
ncbi:hypothetical protein KAR91_21485 [Candidatus Pacearchaeota archaeon]|nr:hypothetical protein [Candidatus Pacearchaeota archaeon]